MPQVTILYDIAFLLFSIFYIPALIFKGKLHKDFLERFGIYDDAKDRAIFGSRDAIWIQAVSVGEVALCRSLIPLIKKSFPERSIVISTITRTGNDYAKKLFSQDAIILYFPLDLSFIVKKVIDKIRPKLYIMVETEIWPGVLRELKNKRVPSVLLNGRISDRSFGKYKLVKRFLRDTLGSIGSFCMQSDLDADRIISMGGDPARVRVTGNMKFDADCAAASKIIDKTVNMFGLKPAERVIVAGSTHGGEEEPVIAAYNRIVKNFPEMKLIIAPRHIERVGEVERVIRKFGMNSVRMSRPGREDGSQGGQSVFVIDAIGHLIDAYSIAEVVYVGGSLIPHGGQNPIEPAILGKPVIFGPYMFNFKNVAASLLEGGGAIRVSDGKGLADQIERLVNDKDLRSRMGSNAVNVIMRNRGATERNLSVVKEVMLRGNIADA